MSDQIATKISTSDKLLSLIRTGVDVYLHAKHRSAIRLVESVAGQLNVKVHRFRYSKSTPRPYSLTFQKAFTEGGIFCIEQMEIAPKSWQLWLKSALDNSSSNSKRHTNFALIVVAGRSPRDLWNGQIDAAFLDRLVYLKASV